jgi:hypothetical protein
LVIPETFPEDGDRASLRNIGQLIAQENFITFMHHESIKTYIVFIMFSGQHHSKTIANKYFEAVKEYWDEKWIELTDDSMQWWASVMRVMKLCCTKK